jgi:hypothetical protein
LPNKWSKKAEVTEEWRMRRTMYWGTAICVGAMLGGGAAPSTNDFGFIGVAPAEAKAFYTKKRVNGRWIKGHFAKKGAGKHVASVSRSAKRSVKAGFANTEGMATRLAGLSTFDAEPMASSALPLSPVAQATAPQATTSPQARQIRVLAQAVPSPTSTGPLVPLTEDERLSKLREALQARASTLTTGTTAAALGARAAPEPQSVSLDFKSGTKTTVFSDGTAITEPFDVGAMRGLAAAPPGPKAGLE